MSETKNRSLLRRFLDWSPGSRPEAVVDSTPWDDLDWFVGPHGIHYPLLLQQTLIGGKETIAPEFASFARQCFKANPIIFACVANRMALFSEARFQFRQRRDGRPGQLFGTPALAPLEQPWSGATTGDMLNLAELYVSLGGNFFAARRASGRLAIMRPDWVAIVLGSDEDEDVAPTDLDAEVLGYMYQPGGPSSGREPVTLLREEVAHFMPVPDPECPWRGMSWIAAVVSEVVSDKLGTKHKERYFEAGGTRNLAVRPNIPDPDEWDRWTKKFREEYEGVANRFKTLFLAEGVDVTAIGSNLTESDFVEVQSAGEVRICAAAMVPPSVVSVSKGLAGSTLNQGNFEAAWRQFANGWARPSWRNISGSLARIIDVPQGAELWYDDRDVPALQEDVKKVAETQSQKAATMKSLIDAGYDPDSVVDAVESDDFTRLEHTGLVSVQLLPPGSEGNGNGSSDALTAQVTKKTLERATRASH